MLFCLLFWPGPLLKTFIASMILAFLNKLFKFDKLSGCCISGAEDWGDSSSFYSFLPYKF